jgi:exodeoxyribonuclease VII small subunit
MSFEQSMARLDEIVALLSDGGTPLEQSLALYAEGAALIGRCAQQLGEARLRMETLLDGKEDEAL